ncbi:MAG: hypothetical protein GC162_07710 [Planctomycetes bacterium]|nr:hypothetical protein [Planctomycetota bacterium]
MSQIVTCSGCHKQLKVKEELAGKRIKCPSCGGAISVPGAAKAAGGGAPAFDLMDEIAPVKKPTVAAGQKPCPKCGSGVSSGAVICTNCGLDLRKGTLVASSLPDLGGGAGGGSGEGMTLKIVAGAGALAALVVVGLIIKFSMGAMSEPERPVAMNQPPSNPIITPQPVIKPPPVVAVPAPTFTPVESAPVEDAAAAEEKKQAADFAARQQAEMEAQKEAERLKALDEQMAKAKAADRAKAEKELQDKINKAIENGQKYLLSQYAGGYKYNGQFVDEIGHTALCVYALLKSGVNPDIPAVALTIEPMLFYAQNSPGVESKGTYNCGLVMLALDQLREVRERQLTEGSLVRSKAQIASDRLRMKDAMRKLLVGLNKNQKGTESYSYGGGAGRGGHDMSIQQYALLGMWAARRTEISLREDWWIKQAQYLMSIQQPDGSWVYKEGKPPTRAMTTAGIGSLAICYLMLNKHRLERQDTYDSPGDPAAAGKVVAKVPKTDIEKAIEHGFDWLGAQGINELNPYFLYGLERACTLTKTQEINGVDWYETNAARLVATQAPDGSWGGGHGPTTATAWNILFLSRATEHLFDKESSPGDAPASEPASPGDGATPVPTPDPAAPAAADAGTPVPNTNPPALTNP